MVFVYIGIGMAILVAIFLLKKILFPSNSEMVCQKCGAKTDGLKCSRCADNSNKQSWR